MHNPSGYMLYDLIKFLNFNIHNIRLAKLSHLVHLNAFSPVWVPSRNFTSWGFICFLQVTWLWEAHLVLLNTFSPLWPFMKLCQLWVLSCFFMSCDPENFLPHLGHKKMFLSCVDFSFFTMVTWSQEHHATLFASKLFLSCDDERTHMGGKPFKCTKCDKSCPLSSYLKAHPLRRDSI